MVALMMRLQNLINFYVLPIIEEAYSLQALTKEICLIIIAYQLPIDTIINSITLLPRNTPKLLNALKSNSINLMTAILIRNILKSYIQ